MADPATEFLTEWTLKRAIEPLSRLDAAVIAETWEAEALENGISAEELHAAAKGDIADYLLRTFGEENTGIL